MKGSTTGNFPSPSENIHYSIAPPSLHSAAEQEGKYLVISDMKEHVTPIPYRGDSTAGTC